MAVYKIFPTKDATLYSAYPNMNTGTDAILEVSNTNPAIAPSPRVARSLIAFQQEEIDDVIDNKVNGANYRTNLRLYVAEASGIVTDTMIEAYPISSSWKVGTGQYLDSPQSTNGVSWNYRNYSGSGAWDNAGGDYINTLTPPQHFYLRSSKDININVTDIVNEWRANSYANYGFMLKLDSSQEFVSGSANQPLFKYFSVDTNTIYPPELEISWNDFTTSSNAPTEITTSDLTIALDENPGVFYAESVNRFRLNVRPTYPARTFQTASIYTTNHSLPTASYYAIKDLDTDEYVVDFDTSYTKISNDEQGNYFDVYMNGLEPERNYKILIQTTVDNSTMVKDEDYIFKVVNG